MIESVVAILSGVLLLAELFSRWAPGKKAVGALKPFQTVIGIVALVIGILHVTSVTGIALILAGLLLAATALAAVPKVGTYLARAGRALETFRIIVGFIVLVVGLVGLLDALSAPRRRGPSLRTPPDRAARPPEASSSTIYGSDRVVLFSAR